ncbi:hypothetical protein PpBr36_00613 [Pyricularia pennisetigena]|uniref:hypothetical protein n=1 Tax=Pyricularia pennisetigena TaxID=1578925 RepID=UPI0011544464|nr:hypothetical protein PpBr36_00613 [Pyricularia pennisetigena]TLS28625.1 hypothetical protein PpBr36_00613 [Pyricularia pennisetigena]
MSGPQFIVERLRRNEEIPLVRKARGFHHLLLASEWKAINDSMTSPPLASQHRTWRADILTAAELRTALDGVGFAEPETRARVGEMQRVLHELDAHVRLLAAAIADMAPPGPIATRTARPPGWTAAAVQATVYGVLFEALRLSRADGAGGACFQLAHGVADLCGAMRRVARPGFDAGAPFAVNATRMAPLVLRLVALCLDVLRARAAGARASLPARCFVDFAEAVAGREEAVVEYEDEPGRAQREEAARGGS